MILEWQSLTPPSLILLNGLLQIVKLCMLALTREFRYCATGSNRASPSVNTYRRT